MQPAVAAYGQKMIAAWSTYEGVFPVEWGYSLDGGTTWVSVGTIPTVNSDAVFGPHAVCADSTGRFYLATRIHRIAQVKMIAVFSGRFEGSNFNWIRQADAPIGVDKAEYGPDDVQLVVDPGGDVLYLACTEAIEAMGTVKVMRSVDQGAHWDPPITLSNDRSNHTRAVLGVDGELYVTWFDELSSRILGRVSRDRGETFEPAFVVATIHNNLTPLIGWDNNNGRSYPDCEVDHPLIYSVAVDHSRTARRGSLYVAWTEQATGTRKPSTASRGEQEPNNTAPVATPVAIGDFITGSMFGREPVSSDCDWFVFEGTAGQTIHISAQICGTDFWSGGPVSGWSYSLSCAGPGGLFFIGGQRTNCTGTCPVYVYTLPSTGQYFIKIACVTNASLSYGLSLREWLIDAQSVARDHRDIALTASADGGATWSAPVKVNDAVGYDDAIPTVGVDDSGRVHVVWYDRRDDPECSTTVYTRWAVSEDGGASFAPSMRLSTAAVHLREILGTHQFLPWTVGNHMAVMPRGGGILAFWAEPRPTTTGDVYEVNGDIWCASVRDDDVTATLITAFRADAGIDGVALEWQLRTDRALRGFRLHRMDDGSGAYRPLAASWQPWRGRGGYVWTDTEVESGGHYRYRLELVSDGESLWEGPISVEMPPVLLAAGLTASPNPFVSGVKLELAAEDAGSALLTVFDVTGHQVRKMVVDPIAQGLYAMVWDGRDERGREVPVGVYVVRARIGRALATRRIVRLD